MAWYYADQGNKVGPVDDSAFESLVKAGTIGPDTLVWKSGLPNWVKWQSIQPSSGISAGSPPPVPDDPTQARCFECGRQFPLDQLIRYEGRHVCGICKPVFFQRIQEGAVSPLQEMDTTGGTGQTPNKEIVAAAKEKLRTTYWQIFCGSLIVIGMQTAIQFAGGMVGSCIPFAQVLVDFFLSPPIYFGECLFLLLFIRNGRIDYGVIFQGFQRRYWMAVGVHVVRTIGVGMVALLVFAPAITAFVFFAQGEFKSVLLLVSSIALALPGLYLVVFILISFAMVFYIVVDDESTEIVSCFQKSWRMMSGVRWKYFCLGLRFVGWMFLGLLACGIGMIFVTPWMNTAFALFYQDVKGRAVPLTR